MGGDARRGIQSSNGLAGWRRDEAAATAASDAGAGSARSCRLAPSSPRWRWRQARRWGATRASRRRGCRRACHPPSDRGGASPARCGLVIGSAAGATCRQQSARCAAPGAGDARASWRRRTQRWGGRGGSGGCGACHHRGSHCGALDCCTRGPRGADSWAIRRQGCNAVGKEAAGQHRYARRVERCGRGAGEAARGCRAHPSSHGPAAVRGCRACDGSSLPCACCCARGTARGCPGGVRR